MSEKQKQTQPEKAKIQEKQALSPEQQQRFEKEKQEIIMLSKAKKETISNEVISSYLEKHHNIDISKYSPDIQKKFVEEVSIIFEELKNFDTSMIPRFKAVRENMTWSLESGESNEYYRNLIIGNAIETRVQALKGAIDTITGEKIKVGNREYNKADYESLKTTTSKRDQTYGVNIFSGLDVSQYNQDFKKLFANEFKKVIDPKNPKYNLIMSDLTRLPQVIGEKGFGNLRQVKLLNGQTVNLEEIYKEYNGNFKQFKTKNRVFEFGNKQLTQSKKGFGFKESKYNLGYDELKETYKKEDLDIEKMSVSDLVIMIRVILGAIPGGDIMGGYDDLQQANAGVNFDGSMQGVGENVFGYLTGVLGITVFGFAVRTVLKGPKLVKAMATLGKIIEKLSKSPEMLSKMAKNEKVMKMLESMKGVVPKVGELLEKVKIVRTDIKPKIELKGTLKLNINFNKALSKIDSLGKDEKYYAHGTNGLSIITSIEKTDGKLLSGGKLDSLGITISNGESKGSSNWNQLYLSVVDIGKAGLHKAMLYAEKDFSVTPINIQQKRNKLKKGLEELGNLGLSKEMEKYYRSSLEGQLGKMEELEKKFSTLSKEELRKYEELSKIPVLCLGKYDSSKIGFDNFPNVGGVYGEVGLPEIKVDIIAVPNEYVSIMQKEISKRNSDILVISYDEAKKFNSKYEDKYKAGMQVPKGKPKEIPDNLYKSHFSTQIPESLKSQNPMAWIDTSGEIHYNQTIIEQKFGVKITTENGKTLFDGKNLKYHKKAPEILDDLKELKSHEVTHRILEARGITEIKVGEKIYSQEDICSIVDGSRKLPKAELEALEKALKEKLGDDFRLLKNGELDADFLRRYDTKMVAKGENVRRESEAAKGIYRTEYPTSIIDGKIKFGTYEGEYKMIDGVITPHGKGKKSTGMEDFEGIFEDGILIQGTKILSDGKIYQIDGKLVNGKLQGVLTNPDGTKIKVVDGKKVGNPYGVKYAPHFINEQIGPKKVDTKINQSISQKTESVSEKGDFSINGRIYEGQYNIENGKNIPHGEGKMKLKDGTEMSGIFTNGQFIQGEIKYQNGFVSKVDINISKISRENLDRSYDVMVVGDLNGKKVAYTENLKTLGVINNSGDWIGGNRTVVFLGDILADRGTDGLEIILNINKLRKQARETGADIKVIAGNHEEFFIDFLTGRINQEGELIGLINSKAKEQGLGLLELKRFGSPELQNMSYDNPKIWEMLSKEREIILLNMRNDSLGRVVLEEICNMELATRIQDSLFIHTNPTVELMHKLQSTSFDIIGLNYNFRKGLESILLRGKRLEDLTASQLEAFKDPKKLFLYTRNRINFDTNTFEGELVNNGINNIFHGHTPGGGVLDMGSDIKVVNVDLGAFKEWDDISMEPGRSVSMIDRNGRILIGENQF